MDEHLAQLSHQVAAAADAWLTDPRDSGVYVRLVKAIEAIEAYRYYRQPQLQTQESEVDLSSADRQWGASTRMRSSTDLRTAAPSSRWGSAWVTTPLRRSSAFALHRGPRRHR